MGSYYLGMMEMMKLNLMMKVLCPVIIFMLVFALLIITHYEDELESETGRLTFSQLKGSTASVAVTSIDSAQNKPPVINASAAVVVEESTGRVLYSKNALERRSIASTTKIMTALLALENGNLEDKVIVSKRAAAIGGSRAGIREGEQYTLRELLYAMLIISGNDAAIAVSEHIGGSVENFAVMMNDKAKSLGAVNSHFVTPHGLDREGQYSTAYDVALITIEALKNQMFCEIVSTSSSYIPGHNLYNTNELLGSYQGVDGVKTGYTGKAGRCLVTTAKKNDMRLISVVLGSPTRTARANASRSLLDYGFANYRMHSLVKEGDIYARIPVTRGIANYVALKAGNTIVLPLSTQEAKAISVIEHVPDVLNAPVYAGSDTGHIEYVLNGKVLAEIALLVTEDIRKTTYGDYLRLVFKTWSRLMREGIFADI
jgi:D-alanyl-D-alanine carboxypeptidase (penicillin-binding protein 5/6)